MSEQLYCVQLMHRRTGRLIGLPNLYRSSGAAMRCIEDLQAVFPHELWDVCIWQTEPRPCQNGITSRIRG